MFILAAVDHGKYQVILTFAWLVNNANAPWWRNLLQSWHRFLMYNCRWKIMTQFVNISSQGKAHFRCIDSTRAWKRIDSLVSFFLLFGGLHSATIKSRFTLLSIPSSHSIWNVLWSYTRFQHRLDNKNETISSKPRAHALILHQKSQQEKGVSPYIKKSKLQKARHLLPRLYPEDDYWELELDPTLESKQIRVENAQTNPK